MKFGIEIETENIISVNLPRGWNISRDASIESDCYYSFGKRITTSNRKLKFNLTRKIMGSEITSPIFDYDNDDYEKEIKNICNIILSEGESLESYRGGIHIHFSFKEKKVSILKKILKLGLYLEDVFFSIGGMGYNHRGFYNDYTYFRPLTDFGPVVVPDENENYYQIYHMADVLKAKNIWEFLVRWGDMYNLSGNRYIPIRYTWLNLYNIFTQKQTIEFRVFNKTLNYKYICMAIELCKLFVETINNNVMIENEINSLYKYREKNEIITTYNKWLNNLPVKENTYKLGLYLIEKSNLETIRPQKEYVFSHLLYHRRGNKCPYHWVELYYRPSNGIIDGDIKIPNFLDIHNLRELGGGYV